jgi:type II secretory pathway component PulK
MKNANRDRIGAGGRTVVRSSFTLHPSPLRGGGGRRRRGTILVTAMWATVAMTGIILVLARTTKVEMTSAGNRVSAVQAAAVVRGAEQYVLSLVENAAGDPTAVVDAPAESMVLGNGYFWLIKPYPDDEQQMAFGVVDEASKLDLNAAAVEELLKLPGMAQDFADAIKDWRDTDATVSNQGAEDDYYLSLPQPYHAKNDRLETVEELRLVKGYTDEILFGLDLNHDGVLDVRERSDDGPAAMYNAANGAGRGIAPFVTVYAAEAVAAGGGGAVNVNDPAASVRLLTVLPSLLDPARATQIADMARRGQPFTSVFDFAAKTGMTADELKKVYKSLTASVGTARVAYGKVNINTAPKEVLLCLQGLDQADVDKLVSARASAEAGDVSWVYATLGPAKAAQVGARLTSKSYQYSADIVAITADGRSFKRVRVVVDARTSPAKIVFRKDLTDLGWPLDEGIRQSLRNGEVLEQPFGTGGGSSLGGGF